MEVLDFFNEYGTLMVGIGQFIMLFVILYLKTHFAPKSLEKVIADAITSMTMNFNNMDKRVAILEERSKNIPTLKDLHKLETHIHDLSGDLKRVDESIDGFVGYIERLEKQVNRQEDFLKRNK